MNVRQPDPPHFDPLTPDQRAYLDRLEALKIEETPPKPNGNGADDGDGFIRHPESKKILPRYDNVVVALRKFGVRLRFNEFSGRIELDGLKGYGPELDDPGAIRLRHKMEAALGLVAPRLLVVDSLTDFAHANRYHPVRDYLGSLQWDGVKRLDTWLVAYGKADDSEFNKAVGALMLIAAVRRVRQPGCKFDTMPVLESAIEGKNKSQALRLMAVRDAWFSDSMELGANPKEAIEQTSGKWIVEIGELHGLSTREEGRIKAFLSRQEDHARESYAHFAKTVGRQCIYVGTTNDNDYLKAEGRRILPVAIGVFDLDRLACCGFCGQAVKLTPPFFRTQAG
jgi:predicted P-loop ATPase